MALPTKQTRVVLAKRPSGPPVEGEHLVLERGAAVPTPTEGEMLVRNLLMSLDPAMRPQMSIRTYVEPMPLGSTVRSTTIGQVVQEAAGSGEKKFRTGDLVMGPGGWQEFYCAKQREVQRVNVPAHNIPLNALLGIMGGTGLTAYFGLLKVGQPKAGETVLVSGAGGATGNVACQIAKNVLGCKVVGIAGGAEKCKFFSRRVGPGRSDRLQSGERSQCCHQAYLPQGR